MKARLSIVLPVLIAILVLPVLASACMCPAPLALDKEFERSATVGVFKITSTFERQERADDAEMPGEGIEPQYATVRQVLFSVEKVFKGTLRPGDEVRLVQIGPTMCDRYFDESMEGTEYLLYLPSDPSKDKEWKILGLHALERCNGGRGGPAVSRKNGAGARKTRLSGTVIQTFWPAAEGEVYRQEILADSRVVITGKGKTVRLKTDKNGVYEIYDLAPGRYRVTPVKIRGYDFIQNEGPAVSRGGYQGGRARRAGLHLCDR